MTVAGAQAAAASLRDALQDYGVRTSIELQPGVGPAADRWGPAPFVRNLGHHIASYPPGTPGLAVVKGGRKGANPLQGPLANCYGGFDLTARIITMGWANHPGAGGPWSVPGWGTVPKDNGRPYILGWEFEGGYLPYTDEVHDFMSRCGAASLDWLGTFNGREPAPLECHDEHKGWAGPRKPDRIGYTTASGRSRIAAVRGTTSGGIPMPLDSTTATEISKIVVNALTTKLIDWPDEAGGDQSVLEQLKLNAEGLALVLAEVKELKSAPPTSGPIKLPTEFDVPGFVRMVGDYVVDKLNKQGRDGDPATGPTT